MVRGGLISMCTVAVAASSGADHVRYFSWYSYGGPNVSASPGRAYTNLAMDRNLTFLQQSYEQLGVPGMLLLQESQWSKPPHSTGQSFIFGAAGLSPSWEAAVDDCIATLTPLSVANGGHIHGIQLGDELVCGGFPLSNLSALANRLHDGLSKHGVMIFTNECFAQGSPCKNNSDCRAHGASGAGRGVCIHSGPGVVFGGCQAPVWPEFPYGLDAVSLDVYGHGATEVAWAKAYYEKYFLPLLGPNQSIWVVPGLFGKNGTLGNATDTDRIDNVLLEKLQAYWSWAQEESKITGFIPWHWTDLESGFQPSSDTLGANEYPKTLRWIGEKVRAIRSASDEQAES